MLATTTVFPFFIILGDFQGLAFFWDPSWFLFGGGLLAGRSEIFKSEISVQRAAKCH
jgi:hypothetical protein